MDDRVDLTDVAEMHVEGASAYFTMVCESCGYQCCTTSRLAVTADDKPRPASATSGTTSTTPPMEAPMPEPITPISDEDMSILREWAENRGAVWPGILVLALLARLDAQTATIKHFTGWLKEAQARAEKFSYSGHDRTSRKGRRRWRVTLLRSVRRGVA